MSNAELLTGTSRKAGPGGTEPPASAVRCFQSPIFIIIFFFFPAARVFSQIQLAAPRPRTAFVGGWRPGSSNVLQVDKGRRQLRGAGEQPGGGRSQVAGRSRELPSVLTGGVRRGEGGGEVGWVLRARGEAPRSPLFVSCLPPPPPFPFSSLSGHLGPTGAAIT